MALPVFQAAGTAVEGLSAISPAWPTHQADDIGLMFVETANQAIGIIPSGWAHVLSSPQGTGTAGGTAATQLTVLWKRATSSSEAALSIGDSGNHQVAQILTFRGCITTGDPWDVTAGDVASTADTAVSIPGATTTVDECLIVLAVSNGTDISTAETSGWANAALANVLERADKNTTQGNGGGFGVATGEKATAGAFGATSATLVTSSVQGRLAIALKPPSPNVVVAPSPASSIAVAVIEATILGSLLLVPLPAQATSLTVNPTVVLGSLALSPAPAAAVATVVDPTVAIPVVVTPTAGGAASASVLGSVVQHCGGAASLEGALFEDITPISGCRHTPKRNLEDAAYDWLIRSATLSDLKTFVDAQTGQGHTARSAFRALAVALARLAGS